MMRMDAFADERDFALLARDRYNFSVLDRILRGPCELILTDHESLILCHSERAYPVWIWTGDGCPDAVKESAWRLAAAHRPFSEGYRINLKYELAEYFIQRAGEAGMRLGYAQRLFAYDCPDPIAPDEQTDGGLHVCTPADAAEAAGLIARFSADIGEAAPDPARCLEKAQAYIDAGAFFFWKNGRGETAACCSYKINQGLACLGSVYTKPEERRKHYALHLVYQVTRKAKDMGFTPMLYTDAEYPASNACYQKIGYALRGALCTLGAR